ncbi:MAG: apolipoprotein N-acyltransferase [Bdellovibrionales bacterium]|nr:apolipoprotein N-acyltransferase [Bdellovibrionales bacterium]
MNYFRKQSLFREILLLAVGVFAFIVSFPIAFSKSPFWIEQLTPFWICIYLLPLLFHLQRCPRFSFLKAWSFYFLGSMGILYWIVISMKNYGELSTTLSISALIATCLFRSLFSALAIYLWTKFSSHTNRWMLGVLLLTLQDYLLHFFPFGGFPWISPGYALTPDFYWIQIADVVGFHGINISIYIVTFLLFELKTNTIKKPYVISLLSFLFVIHLYGIVRLATLPAAKNHPPLQVAWIQGNIGQAMKWNPQEKRNIIQKYQQLTQTLQTQPTDLIIWPEAAVPISFSQNNKVIIETKIHNIHTPIFFGAPSYKKVDQKKYYYNSAFLTDEQGMIIDRYDKIHLVPFGEFLPSFGFDILKKLPAVAGSFHHGNNPKLMQIKDEFFGTSICYEVLYPHMFKNLVRDGATFFVNITNDAWFDLSSGPFQHARFAILRAIETRKPLVRVANTGISALYHPTGKVELKSELFTNDVKIASVIPNKIKTIYVTTRFLAEAIMIILCILIISAWRKKSKYES